MLSYLDPASGSMVLSVIAGGIAGVAVLLKSFGRRILSFLLFWRDEPTPEPADAGEDEAATSSAP